MFMTPKVVCTPSKMKECPEISGTILQGNQSSSKHQFSGDMLIIVGVSERNMCEQMNESAWDGWLGWLASHQGGLTEMMNISGPEKSSHFNKNLWGLLLKTQIYETINIYIYIKLYEFPI